MPNGQGPGEAAARTALRFLPALLALGLFWRAADARLSLVAAAAFPLLFLWAAQASPWWRAALPFGTALPGRRVAAGSHGRRPGLSGPARALLLVPVLALLGVLAARLWVDAASGGRAERPGYAEDAALWSTGRLSVVTGNYRFTGDDGRVFRLRCAYSAPGGRGPSGNGCFSAAAWSAHDVPVSVLHGPPGTGLVPTAAVYEVRAGRELYVDRRAQRAQMRAAARVRPEGVLGRFGVLLLLGLAVWALAPFVPLRSDKARRNR